MAKGFQFRLQSVLDWRKQLADQVQLKVSQQELILVELQRQLEQTRHAIRDVYEQAQQIRVNGLTQPGECLWDTNFAAYLQSMQQKEALLLSQIAKQQQIVTHYRMELKNSRIREKSLALLEEKQRKSFINQRERAEEAELAEIAQRMLNATQTEQQRVKDLNEGKLKVLPQGLGMTTQQVPPLYQKAAELFRKPKPDVINA